MLISSFSNFFDFEIVRFFQESLSYGTLLSSTDPQHYIFYWPTGCLFGTLPFSVGPVAVPMVSTIYGTLPSSIGSLALSMVHTLITSTSPLAISMVHYYILLANWLSIVHYHLLLAQWLSLWYNTIFTGPLAISTVLYYLLLAHWPCLWYTTIFYWFNDPPYGTLLSSTGPLAISMVH